MMRATASLLALAFALGIAPSGCAVSITGAAALSTGGDLKHSEEASCTKLVGSVAAGFAIDATAATTASVTGETFSTPDRVIIGVAVLDVTLATIVAIMACRD